jgi:ribosomal protein S18 acetylase RimI-like enzyme
MHISELPRDRFEGYEVFFSYDSKGFYDLKMRCTENVFALEFVRTPCAPVHKEFVDHLFASHWDDPHAYGLWDGKDMRAILEVTPENWNNRLRVTNLCVQDGYRRRGLGTLLMTRAREIARAQHRRALILETQSCNTGAIAFYLNQGLSLMGFNACEYSNQDVEKHEIRLEMGCLS